MKWNVFPEVSPTFMEDNYWKTGLAQKRIDGIIEMVPELVEGKTIHIDAFLGARPLAREEPISPYLGYTKEEECATQRKIYRYWRDRRMRWYTEVEEVEPERLDAPRAGQAPDDLRDHAEGLQVHGCHVL